MTDVVVTMCNGCARLDKKGISCQAFPAGIPDFMISEGGDHRVPILGDNGIQFMLAEGDESWDLFQLWDQVYGP